MDESKIVIAVCGDSYCAASVNDLKKTGTGPRAHFSQILQDQYGYKIMHFAHGGFSNVAIFFQIKEAIKQKANVVVYNKTWSNRIELYRNDKFYSNDGIKNFFYYDPYYESSRCDWAGKRHSPVLSTTHHGIENSPFFEVTREQRQAIDLYHKYLYNDAVHTLMDSWMFEYWHDQIVRAGALPVLFNASGIGKIAYDFSFANPTFDTPFHTDRATQQQIADNIHLYIVDKLL
jgi:hypothetical protein